MNPKVLQKIIEVGILVYGACSVVMVGWSIKMITEHRKGRKKWDEIQNGFQDMLNKEKEKSAIS